MNKRFIASVVAGIVLLGGTVSPIVAAATTSPAKQEHRQLYIEKIAQNMSDTFGVSKWEVMKFHKDGYAFNELYEASLIAKASGKSLREVVSVKKADNNWRDVAQKLGVTQQKLKATRIDISSTKLNTKLNIPKYVAAELLNNGYHARDIAVANELAKNTDKPIKDVLAMKKINNTWFDVANSLGISQETFKKDMATLKAAFPYSHNLHHLM